MSLIYVARPHREIKSGRRLAIWLSSECMCDTRFYVAVKTNRARNAWEFWRSIVTHLHESVFLLLSYGSDTNEKSWRTDVPRQCEWQERSGAFESKRLLFSICLFISLSLALSLSPPLSTLLYSTVLSFSFPMPSPFPLVFSCSYCCKCAFYQELNRRP